METAKAITRFPAGAVAIPPSKSVSHRGLICAGLAALGGGGESRLENLAENDDTRATRACLSALGVAFAKENGALRVSCASAAGPAPRPRLMDCGESGSTLRFMLPVAAMQGGPFTFAGSPRLMERPLGVYEQLFAEKGLPLRRQADGLTVQGPLPAGDYRLPGNVSSQFVSGLLLALPLAEGDSRILLETPLESAGYVALTREALEAFGILVHQPNDHSFAIPGGQRYAARPFRVEADWSQAAFFLAAGALGRPVGCLGLEQNSLQGDRAILHIMEQMGVAFAGENGALAARPARLKAAEIDLRQVPDLMPVLAVLCSLAQGTSRLTGAGRLRIKESDRLNAMTTELEKLGAHVRQGADSLTITGRPALAGGVVDAHGDHRIAMALAVAAIGCEGPVTLTGWEHVNKSYPDFWKDFEKEAAHG